MEVHHHPDLHHRRKKFKEYLLEFFMIFLAVSMGFIAENVREGIGDREKERHYVESLVKSGGRWNPGVIPPLLSTDPQKIHLLYNKMDLAWGWTDNYIRNMKERLPTAVRLIVFLQEKYGLE